MNFKRAFDTAALIKTIAVAIVSALAIWGAVAYHAGTVEARVGVVEARAAEIEGDAKTADERLRVVQRDLGEVKGMVEAIMRASVPPSNWPRFERQPQPTDGIPTRATPRHMDGIPTRTAQ